MTTVRHVFLAVLKINVWFVTEKKAIRVAGLTVEPARTLQVHEYVTCWRIPELPLL
jgi:hypothetical protein